MNWGPGLGAAALWWTVVVGQAEDSGQQKGEAIPGFPHPGVGQVTGGKGAHHRWKDDRRESYDPVLTLCLPGEGSC